jgi:hypothetical protein
VVHHRRAEWPGGYMPKVTSPQTLIERFGVSPVETMGGGDAEEQALLEPMLLEARRYLEGFPWCGGIKAAYFGMGCGGIFAIFLFDTGNAAQPDGQLFWIVVGDLPPAYLIADERTANPEDALDWYIRLMGAWVDAVEQGRPVTGLIPVNVPPTAEYAAMLASRLVYLQENFFDDD